MKKDSRSSDESISDDHSSRNSLTPKDSLTDVTEDKNGLKVLEQNGLSAHKAARK
jgi:hypothetical protein